MDVKDMKSRILERIKEARQEGSAIDAAKVIVKEPAPDPVIKEVIKEVAN
jgi:hypothetical protein